MEKELKEAIDKIYTQGELEFFWNAYKKDNSIFSQFEFIEEEAKENLFTDVDKHPENYKKFELVSIKDSKIKFSINLETGDFILNGLTIKNNMRRQFELVNDIVSCNSVAVHFRRGDYAKDKHTHAYHGTCPMDYYRTAINRIEQSVENPKYFVFSDDVDWVRKKWPYSLVPEPRFASNYSEVKDYHDMQVMAKCKHNITANSSFSWWGAWLNRNPNKIVISPDQWFKNKEMQNKTHDLIPPTWIRA